MRQREQAGGEIAWEELCWEGSGTENTGLLARVLHRGALDELYTEDILDREA